MTRNFNSFFISAFHGEQCDLSVTVVYQTYIVHRLPNVLKSSMRIISYRRAGGERFNTL